MDVRNLAWLIDQLFCSHQSPYVLPLIPVEPYYVLPVSPGTDGSLRLKLMLTHGRYLCDNLHQSSVTEYFSMTGSAVLAAVPVCHIAV